MGTADTILIIGILGVAGIGLLAFAQGGGFQGLQQQYTIWRGQQVLQNPAVQQNIQAIRSAGQQVRAQRQSEWDKFANLFKGLNIPQSDQNNPDWWTGQRRLPNSGGGTTPAPINYRQSGTDFFSKQFAPASKYIEYY